MHLKSKVWIVQALHTMIYFGKLVNFFISHSLMGELNMELRKGDCSICDKNKEMCDYLQRESMGRTFLID